MHNIKRFIVVALAIGLSTPAFATNLFGDTVNNNQTYNQPTANGGKGGEGGQGGAGGNGTGVGVGVGVGLGGSATGGNANANVDNRNTNTNTALGGQGGTGVGFGGAGGTGIGVGGNAAQGQQQGQGQQQANYGVNSQGQGQSLNNATNTSTATNTNTSTATSQGQNQSANNNGNAQATNVTYNEAANPDRIRVDQAPTVYTSAPNATVSCYKTAGGGISAWFGGASFSGGKIDEACETRELVRLTTDANSANNLLCTFEVYQLANRQKCAGIPIVHLLAQGTRNAIVQPSK